MFTTGFRPSFVNQCILRNKAKETEMTRGNEQINVSKIENTNLPRKGYCFAGTLWASIQWLKISVIVDWIKQDRKSAWMR